MFWFLCNYQGYLYETLTQMVPKAYNINKYLYL